MCTGGGDAGAAWVVVIEIEVERLLLCRKRNDPKISLLNFLITRTGREKYCEPPFCSRPRLFPKCAHPDLTVLRECRRQWRFMREPFLDFVPTVEVVLHR